MSQSIITALSCFLLILIPFVSKAQETIMLSDQGNYALDFSDLDNIRWQFQRHFQIVPGNSQDVDILENVIIETTNEANEKLVAADVWIKSASDSTLHYPLDSFKMQPFDAIWSEYVLTVDLDPGDTLEVKYRIHSDITTNLQHWTLQHAYPVKKSEVSFIIPEVFEYVDHITDRSHLVKEETLDSTFVIGQGISKGRIQLKGLKLTFAEIPPYIEEPFAPALVETRPAFLFLLTEANVGDGGAFLPSWDEQFIDMGTSEWFGRQYRTKSEYRWLADECESILETNYSDALFILKLYEFVHQQFEWDGSYGLFPSHSLAEMRVLKTVNKAAMNMAMLALLTEAGFDAYPVLVTTTDQRPVYPEIPSVNQFNHFLIEVDLNDGKLYVDAGQPLLPTGWIDSGVRRDLAVRLKNYKGSWFSLPDFETSSSLMFNVSVADDFSATGTISASFQGYDAFTERNSLSVDPSAQYWKERAAAFSPDLRIDSVKFENVKNLLEPFNNTVHFHIDPSPDQSELSLHPVPYSFFNQTYLNDSIRVNPLIFPLKMKEVTLINVKLASDLTVTSLPDSQRLRLEGNQSNMSYVASYDQNNLQSRFEIEFDKTRFSPIEYGSLKTYLDEVANVLARYLVVTKE